jgi:hypothetical protein
MDKEMYLKVRSRTFRILGDIDGFDKEYIDGKGYKDGNRIFIYYAEKPDVFKYPSFYKSNNELIFNNGKDSNYEYFDTSLLIDLTVDVIKKNTNKDDVYFNEQELNDINSATSVYVPTIKDSDDFLKKLIKTTLIEKKINLNRLKSKGVEVYSVSNMKTALQNDTKMSVSNFVKWAELLGIKFNIVVEDNGFDRVNPLQKKIKYDSSFDTISTENK